MRYLMREKNLQKRSKLLPNIIPAGILSKSIQPILDFGFVAESTIAGLKQVHSGNRVLFLDPRDSSNVIEAINRGATVTLFVACPKRLGLFQTAFKKLGLTRGPAWRVHPQARRGPPRNAPPPPPSGPRRRRGGAAGYPPSTGKRKRTPPVESPWSRRFPLGPSRPDGDPPWNEGRG